VVGDCKGYLGMKSKTNKNKKFSRDENFKIFGYICNYDGRFISQTGDSYYGTFYKEIPKDSKSNLTILKGYNSTGNIIFFTTGEDSQYCDNGIINITRAIYRLTPSKYKKDTNSISFNKNNDIILEDIYAQSPIKQQESLVETNLKISIQKLPHSKFKTILVQAALETFHPR
jgi:hypothetical protein